MGWISVEERLPAFQEETSILCLLKDQQRVLVSTPLRSFDRSWLVDTTKRNICLRWR